MKNIYALIAALTIGAAGNAAAAEIPAFDTLDADNDGLISVTEAAVHEKLSIAFEQLDANKDGGLSLEEYETALGN